MLISTCLIVVTVSAASVLAQDSELNRSPVSTGPLPVRDHFLLTAGFLAFDPVSADILDKGRWQLDLTATVSNTFANSREVQKALNSRAMREPLIPEQLREIAAETSPNGVYHVDGEMIRTALVARRGLGKGIQVDVTVPVISLRAGNLDSVVEGFHKTFGFSEFGRPGVPRDEFNAFVLNRGTELHLDEAPRAALGDIVVGTKFDISRDSRSRPVQIALQALVKLPTGQEDRFTSSGSTDLGAQFLVTRDIGRSRVHGAVGLLRLGKWEALDLASQVVASATATYERALGSAATGLVQVTLAQTPFRETGIRDLERTPIQWTLGFKRLVWNSQALFVGFTDTIGSFNNTADLGLHVGITMVFD